MVVMRMREENRLRRVPFPCSRAKSGSASSPSCFGCMPQSRMTGAPGQRQGVAVRPDFHMPREVEELHAFFCYLW